MKRLKIPLRLAMEFYSASPSKLSQRKNEIVKGMKGNDAFRDAQSLVLEVEARGKEFDDVCLQIKAGNKSLIATREDIREKLVNLMFRLANQTMFIAEGSETLLKQSGFKLDKQPTPLKPIHAPEGLTAKNGLPGSIKGKVKKVKAAVNYWWEIAEDNGNNGPIQWTRKQSAYVTYTFTALKPATQYIIRSGAVGKDGEVLYCDPITKICQ